MEYTRITLRIPTDLHEELIETANAKSCSMNAEIISRLRVSGETKFGFSENINNLSRSDVLSEAQEARVRELIREAMGK